MFANAIEKIEKFTRPVKFIMRNFESSIIVPGTATLFFVNEHGIAITCKHVADELLKCSGINGLYAQYKSEISKLPTDSTPDQKDAITQKYGYTALITAESKSMFYNCVETGTENISFSVKKHPKYDLAIITINNVKANNYSNYAVFAKDSSSLRRGDFLCRYGYPFAEFSDYEYDVNDDEIKWTKSGRSDTPSFPIEGMYTRYVFDSEGNIFEYELSTPGLRGQSGGPLFDSCGIVYGMQSQTCHLHLGFDQDKAQVSIDGQTREVENHPFLHVGRCITVDVIKEFLNDNSIKYYVGDSSGNIEEINGEARNESTETI